MSRPGAGARADLHRRAGGAIRHATDADLQAVLDLWRRCAAAPSATDRIAPLRTLLAADPHALIVAEQDGALVGSLIAAWNGWRGSFYRLAVDPEQRRRGLATLMVRRGEEQLRRRGALRLDAIVASDEGGAADFWSAAGYSRQDDRRRFVRNL